MTKTKFARLATLAAAAALSCSGAFAADNYTMSVSAQVVGVCALSATPNLNFGLLDQIGGVDLTPTVTVQYRCTKKATAPTVSLGAGAGLTTTSPFTGALSAGGADTIPYTLSWVAPAAPNGFGAVGPVSLVLTASMLAVNYQNVAAGNYSQNVPVSITP